jgi:hypothetical protein
MCFCILHILLQLQGTPLLISELHLDPRPSPFCQWCRTPLGSRDCSSTSSRCSTIYFRLCSVPRAHLRHTAKSRPAVDLGCNPLTLVQQRPSRGAFFMRSYILVVRIWDGICWVCYCFDCSTDFAKTASFGNEKVGTHAWSDVEVMVRIILLFDGEQFWVMSTKEGVLPIWLLCPGLVGSAFGLSKSWFAHFIDISSSFG